MKNLDPMAKRIPSLDCFVVLENPPQARIQARGGIEGWSRKQESYGSLLRELVRMGDKEKRWFIAGGIHCGSLGGVKGGKEWNFEN